MFWELLLVLYISFATAFFVQVVSGRGWLAIALPPTGLLALWTISAIDEGKMGEFVMALGFEMAILLLTIAASASGCFTARLVQKWDARDDAL